MGDVCISSIRHVPTIGVVDAQPAALQTLREIINMVKSKSNAKVSRSRKTGMGGAQGDQIVKHLTFAGGPVATTAGSLIVVDATTTAAAVQSLPATEWASFAARYQQFRVKQVRLRLTPVYPVSGPPTAAGLVGHSQLFISDFIGASVPATAVQVLSDERSVTVPTFRDTTFVTTWLKNPNAKLWNPTAAALPVANSFGVSFASNPNSGTVMAALTSYYVRDIEWVVEFRGSQ